MPMLLPLICTVLAIYYYVVVVPKNVGWCALYMDPSQELYISHNQKEQALHFLGLNKILYVPNKILAFLAKSKWQSPCSEILQDLGQDIEPSIARTVAGQACIYVE